MAARRQTLPRNRFRALCMEQLESLEMLSVTQLTSGINDHRWPSINSNGDVVYSQQVNGQWEVFKLSSGATSPVQLTGGSFNKQYPSISDNGDTVFFQDGGSDGKGWKVVRRSSTGIESTIETSSRNGLTGAHRDAGMYPSIASNGAVTSYYDFYPCGRCPGVRRIQVSNSGRLPQEFFFTDYPDVNASHQLIYTNTFGIVRATVGSPLPGRTVDEGSRLGRINDRGDIVTVSGNLDDPGSIRLLLAPDFDKTIDIATGAWADVNNSGIVVYEAKDANGTRQVYRWRGPNLALNDATTLDLAGFQRVSVTYEVSGATVPQFTLRGYLSRDELWDDTDIGLEGATVVEIEQQRQPDVNGNPVSYTVNLTLSSTVRITKDERFVIVVAELQDPMFVERTSGDNQSFVIPLFSRIGSHGGGFRVLDNSLSIAGGELDYVNAINSRIMRLEDGKAPKGLVDLTQHWTGANRTVKNEEPTSNDSPMFAGDDNLVAEEVLPPLRKLSGLIDRAASDGRFGGGGAEIRITEAFDEEGEHTNASLHYEGRAIDFGLRNWPSQNDGFSRLTGLAMLAGFDRFDWEVPDFDHVHVSVRGPVSKVSAADLERALEWGQQKGLITNSGLFTELHAAIHQVNEIVRGRELVELGFQEARAALDSLTLFMQLAERGEANRQLLKGFGSYIREATPPYSTGFTVGTLQWNAGVIADGFLASRPGDLDNDRDVDSADLLGFLGNWTGALDPNTGGKTPGTGDLDGDADVDSADLLWFLGEWTGAQNAGALAQSLSIMPLVETLSIKVEETSESVIRSTTKVLAGDDSLLPKLVDTAFGLRGSNPLAQAGMAKRSIGRGRFKA